LGRSIICGCGQRNDLAVFGFGEAKLCLACGSPLELPADPFIPEVPPDAFAEDGPPGANLTTAFESPAPDTAEVAADSEVPAPAIVRERIWTGGIREVVAEAEAEPCSRCGRAFRGAWDRHERPGGPICHLCAVRADATYQPPSQGERRDLFRPVPPKPMATPELDTARAEEREKKKRGLLIIAAAGVVTVLLAVVMPVEVWMASFFATDLSRALELPAPWLWTIRVLSFATVAFAQGTALYVTLAMMNLLYEDRRDNVITVVYLGVAFAVLNRLVRAGEGLFLSFGPAAGAFVALALFLSFVIKIMMIADRFHLRAENGLGFVLAWLIVSILLSPCIQMVERLLAGTVAAIAL